jgi:signal transduction histidine kinase
MIIEDNSQMTILAVDDTEANIDMLLAILKKYNVIPAASVENAMAILEKEKVDLVLLDIIMPGIDGFEMCHQIKNSPKTADIPVIFITAKGDEESIEEAYKIGGVDYITKPFRPRELMAKVRTHLNLQLTKELLKKQVETQRELLHVLCHDLINPLGAIESYSEYLLDYPNKKRVINDILSASRDVMNIIDLTRRLMATEEKELLVYPINLKQSMDQSLAILKVKTIDKKIGIQLDIPENVMVIAEEISLVNTVFNNLITNAIKFSESGTSLKIYLKKQDPQEICIVIEDSGIGIPKQLLSHLFDISKATNRPGTNGESGTGFGMPLVQKFMRKYGGDIFVLSRSAEEFPDDHGTKVCLTFIPG